MNRDKILILISVVIGGFGILTMIIDLLSRLEYGRPLEIGVISGAGAMAATGVLGVLMVSCVRRLEARLIQLENSIPGTKDGPRSGNG